MIDLKNVKIIDNKYEDFYTGNRRTSLEYGMSFSKGGIFAQFGVYKGESAKWILESNKCEELYLYDSFEGLPEDWNNKFKKGHFKCDIPNFEDNRVIIYEGLFNETIDKFNNIKFDLVHIDCDLYSATKTVLDNLIYFKNQIIVFDELYNIQGSQNHEMKAFVEWVNKNNIKYEILGKTNYSQVIIKIIK
jgi:hypothetical protein